MAALRVLQTRPQKFNWLGLSKQYFAPERLARASPFMAQKRSARCPLFGRNEGKSGRRGYRCYCVRILYATIRATMLTKISSAERDFRIIGLVEWRAADRPG